MGTETRANCTTRRKNMVAIDTLSFEFQVQKVFEEKDVQGQAKEGAYVRSMILEGAQWNNVEGELEDAEPMQLYAPFPITLFKPVAKKKSSSSAPQEPMYQCPLYMYPIRTGTRERPSFVVWLDIKSGAFDPSFWIKRGTAMLLATAL